MWGIYIQYEGDYNYQFIYHADKVKENLKNYKTYFEEKPWTWLNNKATKSRSNCTNWLFFYQINSRNND